MNIRDSIVGILAKSPRHKYAGTGFFVENGLILTCAHVMDGAREIEGKIPFHVEGIEKWQYAELIHKSDDTELDFAILKPINPDFVVTGLPLVTSRQSDGHNFKSFGYPLEGAGQGLRGVGNIHGWVRDPLGRDSLQIASDEITHGFSGCPVWDDQAGGVIGMVRTGFDFGLDKKFGRVAFAIPSEVLKEAWPNLAIHPAATPKPDNIRTGAVRQLPAEPADFVGRAEQLNAILSHERAAISGLSGMGGVGKTALGLVAAHRMKEKYPDAQFFIDLRGTSQNLVTAQEAMRHVILSFERTTDLRGFTDDQLRGLYLSLLTDKHCLLFLDNARNAAQVGPLLPPAGNALLITSRTHFRLEGMGEPLRLDVLPEDEAIKLLVEICPRLAGTDGTAQIAKRCGYLPLALKIAGTFLAEHGDWKVDQYIQRLDKQRLKTLTDEDDSQKGVEAVFALSYELLDETERAQWRALGVFSAPFSLEGLGAVCVLDEQAAPEFAGKVTRMSLLEFDDQTEHYHLHDLLKEFAVGKLDSKETFEARWRHAVFFLQLAEKADQLYLEGGEKTLAGLKLFDNEWAHLQAAQKWAAENLESGAAELAMRLPNAGINCMMVRLAAGQRIDWLESGLRAAHYLHNKEFEGGHLANLGMAYAVLGETRRAIESYEHALMIVRKIGDRRGEGSALSNLGVGYVALGETRKAIECHEQALLIARETDDRRGEAAALGNLGLAYANLDNALKAIEYHEQALLIHRKIGDRRGEGDNLGNLGSAYYALGDARKAIKYYEQALLIDREIGDRRAQETTLDNLGGTYVYLGETRKAVTYFEEHLVIARELGDREGEGNALGNLGSAYTDLGETRKAIEHCEQALVIDRELGDRRGEGNALGNLGIAYAALGETRRAIEHYQQALNIDREIGDWRGEGTGLFNLGLAYQTIGELARARQLGQQALEIYLKIEDPHAEQVERWLEALGE